MARRHPSSRTSQVIGIRTDCRLSTFCETHSRHSEDCCMRVVEWGFNRKNLTTSGSRSQVPVRPSSGCLLHGYRFIRPHINDERLFPAVARPRTESERNRRRQMIRQIMPGAKTPSKPRLACCTIISTRRELQETSAARKIYSSFQRPTY